MNHTTLAIAAAFIFASAGIACSASDDERVSKKASALTDPVAAAEEAPTGVVDAESIQAILQQYQSLDALLAGGQLPGGLDADYDFDAVPEECVTDGGDARTIDLSCVTDGLATGSITFELGSTDGTEYTHLVFAHVCADGVCANGEGAIEAYADAITVACDLDVEGADGEVTDIDYGVQSEAAENWDADLVMFGADAQSYVIDVMTSFEEMLADLDIEGVSGTFDCSLSIPETELPEGVELPDLGEILEGACSSAAGVGFEL